MAVSKMSKMTLIAEQRQQNKLLQMLQEFQKVEIENIFQEDLNQEWLKEYFPDSSQLKDEEPGELKNKLDRLQEAISFIRHHGSAKQKIQELKRTSITFKVLEESFKESDLLDQLTEIESLKALWEANEEVREKWQQAEDWATIWQNLDVSESEIPQSSSLFIGTIENSHWEDLRAALQDVGDIYHEVIYSDAKTVAFSALFLKEKKMAFEKFVQQFGVSSEQNPYQEPPKVLLKNAKEELKRIAIENKEITRQLGQQKSSIAQLQKAEEIYLARFSRAETKSGLVHSEFLVVIRGWLPVDEQPLLTRKLEKRFQESVYVTFEEPTPEELAENKIPIKLKNAKFIQPFEMLTEMYSLPKYDEIDPTPWMTPFYYVFFGMMVADIGYGLLMLVVTTIGLHLLRLPKGTNRFLKLFQILSVPTMAWGIIYGTFFGIELPFQLLAPTKDFMAIFILSMVFAGIQIFTGLFLAAKENLRKKDILGAINEGFSWQGILTGILIAVAGSFLIKSQAIMTLGMIIAGISALFVIVVPVLRSKTKVGGFFLGLYDLYGVTSYIGDFVSYSRLMALGISGGSIAAAFNMLVGYLPLTARFTVGIVLIVVLQGLNIFLTLLSAYVHAARLQYVEFFGKFFTGGGRGFKPFKPAEKYLNFEEEDGGKEK